MRWQRVTYAEQWKLIRDAEDSGIPVTITEFLPDADFRCWTVGDTLLFWDVDMEGAGHVPNLWK